MPGIKYPIFSANSLFLSKRETKEHVSIWKRNPYTRILSRTKVPKKPTYYGWTHPCGSLNFKGSVSTLGKNRFLSSYSTIIIWQFKIVIYFVSGIHHVFCALNPQLKFLDATYVQNMSEGSDITGCSHSLSDFLLRNCFTHSEFKKPEALQSTPIRL